MLLGLYHNDQPRTNFLLLNISALWLVSRWSAKAKYQGEDIWRILLGLCHNDQPRANFPLLNIFSLWLVSWWSGKAKMSRWKYVRYVPWFVSRWSTKDKFSFPEHNCTLARIAMISQGKMSRWGHMGMLLGLYHNDQPRRKMNMMRDIGRSKKIRGESWCPPCLPFSGFWPDDGLAAAAAAAAWGQRSRIWAGKVAAEQQRPAGGKESSSVRQRSGAIKKKRAAVCGSAAERSGKRERQEQSLWRYL